MGMILPILYESLIKKSIGLDVMIEKGLLEEAGKLTGAALERFNRLHIRDRGGKFAKKVGTAVSGIVGGTIKPTEAPKFVKAREATSKWITGAISNRKYEVFTNPKDWQSLTKTIEYESKKSVDSIRFGYNPKTKEIIAWDGSNGVHDDVLNFDRSIWRGEIWPKIKSGRFYSRTQTTAEIPRELENFMRGANIEYRNFTPIIRPKESILNLKIQDPHYNVDDIVDDYVKNLYNYIRKPEGLQKDLARTFGHIEVKGAEKISIEGMFEFNNSFKAFLKNTTMYNPFEKTINVNLAQIGSVQKQIGFLTPKQLLEHEYAHSITMIPEGRKILLRHLKNWARDIKKLEGAEVTVNGALCRIEKVTIVKKTVKDAWKITVDGLKANGIEVDEDVVLGNKNLSALMYSAKLRIREGNNVADIPSEMITGVIGNNLMNGLDPVEAFKIRNSSLDWRDIYGLSCLTEYISVMAEKGKRI